MIKNYIDLKAAAIINGKKMESEVPKMFGYKSRWGLKVALDNPKKKEKILKKANTIFGSS
ncbi:hypothetical protein [Cetobacterium sp.]|uniref:hypothetical protein n=1 Tax=Cetobacterium sp. TaxID=2071632 RepID=UPI003F3946D4